MKYPFLLLICCVLGPFTSVRAQEVSTLKDAFAQHFHIGTALNHRHIQGQPEAAMKVLEQHFNSIVAENSMKSMYLQPKEGEFQFDQADQFVALGEKYGMHMVGHTLIWHSQAPSWFFTDNEGKEVSKEVLIERMRTHIHTVVGRYKGRIHGWDVLNEAVLDNGTWRQSPFYKIIGEEFATLAFQFAHEADPDAELYYNDYNTAIGSKRDGIVRLVQGIQQAGSPIHAVGMQEHHHLQFPPLEEVEKSIKAFAALGVKVMVTEMDVSVLPQPRPQQGADLEETAAYQQSLNPYTQGLPDDVMEQLGKRYLDFFTLYTQHAEHITRVTLWGIADHESWLNNFPVRGRTNYPLLFDRQYQAKPFVRDLIQLGQTSGRN